MLKKRTLISALSLTSLVVASGCGITSMPDKMDQSNATQAQLLNGMTTSNNTQSKLLKGIDTSNGSQTALLSGINASNSLQQQLLSGITASNSLQSQLLTQLQQSNQTQAGLTEGMRLQKLEIALQNLTSDDSKKYLYPLPLNMMLWGQTAAQTMHEDEFMGEITILLNDVNASFPFDPNNPPSTMDPAMMASTDKDKLADLWAIRILAGEAPQSLIQQMMTIEITQGGANAAVVPAVLAARWDFLYNDLFNIVLKESPLDNPGKIETCVGLAQEMDYIAATNSVTPILQVGGMLIPTDAIADIKPDPTTLPATYQTCADAFTQTLAKQFQPLLTGSDDTSKAFQQLQATVQARITQLKPAVTPTPPAPAAPTTPSTPAPTTPPTPATPTTPAASTPTPPPASG